jgi:hypothetical protein
MREGSRVRSIGKPASNESPDRLLDILDLRRASGGRTFDAPATA